MGDMDDLFKADMRLHELLGDRETMMPDDANSIAHKISQEQADRVAAWVAAQSDVYDLEDIRELGHPGDLQTRISE